MNRLLVCVLFLLLVVILAASVAGCNNKESAARQPAVLGTREPRTSFGKAVDSAKRVSGKVDERAREMGDEAARAGE